MSHKMYTPLYVISSFSGLMIQDDIINVKHKEILNIINHSGVHLFSMINHILNISKIKAGQFELTIEKFGLVKLLQKSGKSSVNSISGKGTSSKIQLPVVKPVAGMAANQPEYRLLRDVMEWLIKFSAWPLSATTYLTGLLLALFLLPSGIVAATAEPAHVLILLSYHHGYSWEDDILQGFETWDGAKSDLPIFHVEWMDTKRYASAEYRLHYQRFFQEKYAGRSFELLVTVDDNALIQAVKTTPLRDIPIVFSGINGNPATLIGERGRATGIAERFNVGRTLRLAVSLLPNTERLIFITAADESGAGNRKTIDKDLVSLPPGIRSRLVVEHWTPSSLTNIESHLTSLPDNAVVFALGSIPNTEGGRPLGNEQLVAYVRRKTRVPVFSDTDRSVGHGAVGGYVNSGLENGRMMAKMARRILAGESPENLPVVFDTPQSLKLDFNELKRFGISAKNLPPDAEVLNRPATIFDPEYRETLIGFIAAILFLILVLVSLVMRGHMKLLKVQNERAKELQIANEALVQATTAAESANRAKSIFLANMSHELRTPLNAILGFSELMAQDDTLSAKQKETLGIINRSGAHLLNMINDVLDISKIEAGHLALEIVAFDLFKLLKDISNMIKVRAATKQLHFRLEISPAVPQYIEADSGKLQQVLINFLGNAIKFTPQGGQILLRADSLPLSDAAKMMLNIEVIDSGMGIPADQLDNLFKPFVQLTQNNVNEKGTGLGLAISKSLVERMGGHLCVKSELGTGSTFKVELPVTLAHADALEKPAEMRQVKTIAPNQPEWRLLIVDDSADNRLLLATILTEVGFEVREAENGQQTIQQFEQWQPHLIWMDMRMPVMDGYQATAKIRQLPGGDKVKIIAVTASAFKEQRANIIAAGCDALILKPIQAAEVFSALSTYLDVEFVYQEQPTSSVSSTRLELTPEMLSQLPLELRQQLLEAAANLDIDETDAVIAQIRDLMPDIAEELQKLAQGYQFEQIIQLIEAANHL